MSETQTHDPNIASQEVFNSFYDTHPNNKPGRHRKGFFYHGRRRNEGQAEYQASHADASDHQAKHSAEYQARHERTSWREHAANLRKFGGRVLDLGVNTYANAVYGRAAKRHVDAALAETEAHKGKTMTDVVAEDLARGPQPVAGVIDGRRPAEGFDDVVAHSEQMGTEGDVLVAPDEHPADLDLPQVAAPRHERATHRNDRQSDYARRRLYTGHHTPEYLEQQAQASQSDQDEHVGAHRGEA